MSRDLPGTVVGSCQVVTDSLLVPGPPRALFFRRRSRVARNPVPLDAVETWQDILAPQAIDLAVLVAFLALALVSFFRKSVPLKYVTFAFAVGYLGFVKSHLISIVDIFGL